MGSINKVIDLAIVSQPVLSDSSSLIYLMYLNMLSW